jgi:hypothetical protein
MTYGRQSTPEKYRVFLLPSVSIFPRLRLLSLYTFVSLNALYYTPLYAAKNHVNVSSFIIMFFEFIKYNA